MRPLLAIAADTLRALTSRRLFWLHLWLSIAVALIFASVSGTDTGWSAGFGLRRVASTWLQQNTSWETTLQCWVLSRAVRWWVVSAGALMALFATAAVLPESLEAGQSALLMPKARRRAVLLGGRFLGSLYYFVLLTAAAILLLQLAVRWRMGFWHAPLWYALPAAALLFVPLHAVATLMGVLTRSTTAALLVALLFGGATITLHEAAESRARKAETPVARTTAPAASDDDDDDESAWDGHFAGTLLQGFAAALPGPTPTLAWAERRACPVPPRSYRDLFRRLRAGRSGIEAAAAEAIATVSPQSRTATLVPGFPQSSLGAAGLSAFSLAIALVLLHRRDL